MSEYPTAEEELKAMTKRLWDQADLINRLNLENSKYRAALAIKDKLIQRIKNEHKNATKQK